MEHCIHFRINERAVASLGVVERSEDVVHRDAAHEGAGVAVLLRLGDSHIENNEERSLSNPPKKKLTSVG